MYMRMCGGKDEMDTGCNNITKYEDIIMEALGDSVPMLEDMSGAVCVCEESDCNTLKSSDLVPSGAGGGAGSGVGADADADAGGDDDDTGGERDDGDGDGDANNNI